MVENFRIENAILDNITIGTEGFGMDFKWQGGGGGTGLMDLTTGIYYALSNLFKVLNMETLNDIIEEKPYVRIIITGCGCATRIQAIGHIINDYWILRDEFFKPESKIITKEETEKIIKEFFKNG